MGTGREEKRSSGLFLSPGVSFAIVKTGPKELRYDKACISWRAASDIAGTVESWTFQWITEVSYVSHGQYFDG